MATNIGRVWKFASRLAAPIIVVALFSGPIDAQTASTDREKLELVSQLVAKGDRLREQNKESARSAYLLARDLARDMSVIVATDQKIAALGDRTVNLLGQMGRMQEARARAFDTVENTSDLTGFPKRTPASDAVNLRMLLDDRLISDPLFTAIQVPDDRCNLIVSRPNLSMTQIRETYGAPSMERVMKNGGQILTYGMFRIFGDSAGRASVVVFGQ